MSLNVRIILEISDNYSKNTAVTAQGIIGFYSLMYSKF